MSTPLDQQPLSTTQDQVINTDDDAVETQIQQQQQPKQQPTTSFPYANSNRSGTNFPFANAGAGGRIGFGQPPLEFMMKQQREEQQQQAPATAETQPFQNQPHPNPQRHNDKVIGTYGLPPSATDDIVHTANNICDCGQYHSVLSETAELVRKGHLHIMRGGMATEAIEMSTNPDSTIPTSENTHGQNPFLLIMQMNQFLAYWSSHNPEAFGEVIEDDVRRKKLGVVEELIQVSLQSTPINSQQDRQVAIDAVQQMTEVNKVIAPLVQDKWKQQQQQQRDDQQTALSSSIE